MAKGDIEVLSGSLGVHKLLAEDRTNTSINATLKPGEMVKRGGTGANFAILMLTGDPEQGTDIMLGVVAEESTETSSDDGNVDVDLVTFGTKLRGNATTSGNIDTQAKLDALFLDYIAIDGPAAASTASFNYTFNENEGDDPNVHGFQIIGGDIVKGTLDVLVASATMFGSTV